MKSNVKYILIAIIIGLLLGRYTYSQYKEENMMTIKQTNDNVYLVQVGVYKDINIMKESSKKLKYYLYYKDKKGYHVLIGITKNKNNMKKIGDSFEVLSNIYMKRVKIENQDFLELLDQYDDLINQTDNKEIIINAQKQILSKYEELVLNNEE